jgi:hypothetical protein
MRKLYSFVSNLGTILVNRDHNGLNRSPMAVQTGFSLAFAGLPELTLGKGAAG